MNEMSLSQADIDVATNKLWAARKALSFLLSKDAHARSADEFILDAIRALSRKDSTFADLPMPYMGS